MTRDLLAAEIRRLRSKIDRYGPEIVWEQNEFSEILPNPKPLSLSLLRRLAGHDGATGTVCRSLGVTYDPGIPVDDYLDTVFGRTFINRVAERRLTGAGTRTGFLRKLGTAARIRRELTTSYRLFDATLATFDADYHPLARVDPTPLSDAALLARLALLVATLDRHFQEVVKAGILAKCCLDDLADRVAAPDLAALLAIDGCHLPGADPESRRIFRFRAERLAEFAGFAAETDYELSSPRYLESETPPAAGVSASTPAGSPAGVDRTLRSPLLHFKLYESLKINYKAVLLRDLHLLRQSLLEHDRRRQGSGATFYLNLEELLAPERRDRSGKIERRKAEEEAFTPIEVPTSVRAADLPAIAGSSLTAARHPLRGRSVSGSAFSGRAVVCLSKTDIARAGADDILVVKHATPDLVMTFGRVRGIVAETGGLLSHLAIVARERGFPLIIQVRDATALIADGVPLAAGADGTVAAGP